MQKWVYTHPLQNHRKEKVNNPNIHQMCVKPSESLRSVLQNLESSWCKFLYFLFCCFNKNHPDFNFGNLTAAGSVKCKFHILNPFLFFIKTWYSLFKVLYNFLKKKEEIDLDFDSEEVSYCFFLTTLKNILIDFA